MTRSYASDPLDALGIMSVGGCAAAFGTFILIYSGTLPPHTTNDVLLVGNFLSAGRQKLLARIFEPVHFYSSLLQLILLWPVIGERTQGKIIRELTLRYFLGEQRVSFERE